MNRPWKVWLGFAVCLAVLLAAMGWMSVTTLRLDRAQREAARLAELEERARLALWRMDSTLTALFVEESARPANAYQAFYETERAYAKSDNTVLTRGEVLEQRIHRRKSFGERFNPGGRNVTGQSQVALGAGGQLWRGQRANVIALEMQQDVGRN